MKTNKRISPRRLLAGLLSVAMMVPAMATSAFAITEENMITTASKLPDAIKDQNYTAKMESKRDAVIWDAIGLPDGLSIDVDTGFITGIPTTTSDYKVSITDFKNNDDAVYKQFDLKVLDSEVAPKITTPLASNGMREGHKDVAYYEQFTATGGNIKWSATGLPTGLKIISSSGVISGIPTEGGVFNVNVTAENSVDKETRPYTLVVTSIPEIITTGLPDGVKGEVYNTSVLAECKGTIAWSAKNLPRGLIIDANSGVIGGIPTETGKFDVEVTAATSAGNDVVAFGLTVHDKVNDSLQDIEFNTELLEKGVVGQKYAGSISVLPSNTMVNWELTGLPRGINYSTDAGSTCYLSGTPVESGRFNVTATISNEAESKNFGFSFIVDPDQTVYNIIGSIDNGGKISGTNPQEVKSGEDSEKLVFTAANGYRIQKATVNGMEVTQARGKTTYIFDAVTGVDKDYAVVVTTELIPSREEGLGIDNVTINYGENISATNAGGKVEVGGVSDYDSVSFRSNQHTVAFTPENGWKHAATFEVIVTDQDMNVTRFTMKVPNSNGTLSIANSSSGTQKEWDNLFPKAKATVRGKTVNIRFADDVADMPYQVMVKIGFKPTLTATASSKGGDVSSSSYSVYAEADSRYKVSKAVLTDPVTGKSLNITSLPQRENSRGEYYDRNTGDFAGLLNTRIAGETARVWIEGNIETIKEKGYITEMDIFLNELPIALKAEFSFSGRNANDAENDDYDEHIFEDNTGNLTIKNVVKSGSSNKAFTFTLYFPTNARNEEFEIDGDVTGWVAHEDQIILYGGEQATIYGLPEGTKYSVEMNNPGSRYKTNIDISNGNEIQDALDTGNFSIRDGKLTTITFTSTNKANEPASGTGNGTNAPIKGNGGKDNPHTGR